MQHAIRQLQKQSRDCMQFCFCMNVCSLHQTKMLKPLKLCTRRE